MPTPSRDDQDPETKQFLNIEKEKKQIKVSSGNSELSVNKKKLFGSNYNLYQQQQQQHQQNAQSENMLSINNNLERYIKPRQQLIFMLMWVVVIFYVCVFPIKVWWITLMLIGNTQYIRRLKLREYWYISITLRILFYTNSTINPILYNCLSRKFRQSFKRILYIFVQKRGGKSQNSAANNANIANNDMSTTNFYAANIPRASQDETARMSAVTKTAKV